MRARLTLLVFSACLLVAVPSAAARERSMFVSQQVGGTGTAWYSIDLGSGALTKNGGMINTGAQPTVPGITPDGRFAYIGDYSLGGFHGFSVDNTNGLVELAGSPIASTGGPNAALVDPEGENFWGVHWDSGELTGYSVAGDGSFAARTGFPVTTGGTPTTLAISPRNRFVYAPTLAGNSVAGFRRGSDGSLSALTGFPFALATGPMDAEFSVDGRFLFVAGNTTSDIAVFSVDQTSGELTSVPGSPFAAPSLAVALAASPSGEHLVVAGQNGDVWSMEIAGDGSLSPITQTTAGSSPNDVTLTPDGRFAYVANFWSGTISGYELAGDGTLTALAGSPFGDVSGAVATFAIVPNQGPRAAAEALVEDETVHFDASLSSDPDGRVAAYAWNYGDGNTEVSTAARTTHSYAAPGTYSASLTVIDDENCSDTQVGTGQTLYCNGSAVARWQQQVVIAAPPPGPQPPFVLTLTEASARQAKTQRRGRSRVRRISARFRLNADARVSFRFQKFCRRNACGRSAPAQLRGKARFRNYGRRATLPARSGRNTRIFTRRLGGRTITPGVYRVRMQATDSSGRRTGLVTTRRFRVR
jgi:6-phosphogluconolactonase (cycloisomerase 2 family)